MLRVLYLSDSAYMHNPSFNHPENPKRIQRVMNTLRNLGFSWEDITTTSVDRGESLKLAERIHAKGYLEYLVKLSQKAPALVDEDTYFSKDSLELALSAFYYSYSVALSSSRTPVFIVLRPPGHHAGKGGKAMGASTQGFCLLNNAAAAVLGFEDAGFKNIAVVDFDAHHGNGTMEIFYKMRILQLDLHQDPDTLYPHTGYPDQLGEGEGFGYKLNLILPPSSGDDLFTVLVSKVQSALEHYAPEALVISAGFDGYINDGLADLSLTEVSYYSIGRVLAELEVPTVVVFEGGYGIGLERGVRAFVEGLARVEKQYKVTTRTPSLLYRKAVETAGRVLSKMRVR
ncbi:MAG: histone deacetylase family protein [Desulfurococcaceae archaeon]